MYICNKIIRNPSMGECSPKADIVMILMGATIQTVPIADSISDFGEDEMDTEARFVLA